MSQIYTPQLAELHDTAHELREFVGSLQSEQLEDIEKSIRANQNDPSMLHSLQARRAFVQANLEHGLNTGACTRMQQEAVRYFNEQEGFEAHPITMRYANGNPWHEGTVVRMTAGTGKSELYLFDPSFKQFSPPTDDIFNNQHRLAQEFGITDKSQLPGYRLSSNPQTAGWHAELLDKGFVKLTPEIAQQYKQAFGTPPSADPMADLREMTPGDWHSDLPQFPQSPSTPLPSPSELAVNGKILIIQAQTLKPFGVIGLSAISVIPVVLRSGR